MTLKERYKTLSIIGMISASPLALMMILVLSGFDHKQMILFSGLEVNDNSILAFGFIVICLALVLVFSLWATIILTMQQIALAFIDRKIRENPDRNDFYIQLRKIVE